MNGIISRFPYSSFCFEKKKITRDSFEDSPLVYDDRDSGSPKAAVIGEFIVVFSNLEGFITKWTIPQMIGNLCAGSADFNYKLGHSIVNKLSAIDKFNLQIEVLMTYLHDGLFPEDSFITNKKLNQLKKMLAYAAEARNIVAHADWSEAIDGEWYVTAFSHNKTTGQVDYTLHKLTDEALENAINYVKRLTGELVCIHDAMPILTQAHTE